MEKKMPGVVFAAPKSGSGKTMITCGIIEVFKRKKMKVASFKCGPDYIDPMFHRRVLGVESGNLDTFFTDEKTTRYLYSQKAKEADITVVEGVMGYYDGLGGRSEAASTYELAKVLHAPVVLIVDAKGASVSLAALIKGMMTYRQDSGIRGIILNQVSASYYERIKEVIEKECGILVLGYLPKLEGLEISSRHLGLVAPSEVEEFGSWVGQVADALERTVDTDRLLLLAGEAEVLEEKEPEVFHLTQKVRLGVARDEAFSFNYAENMALLERMGAEPVYFSPIHDEGLPEGIDGLLLGGGYPENFAGALQANASMRAAVKKACEKKMPCLAECGGFLYLQNALEGSDGVTREMAGVLTGEGFRTNKLTRFGYVEARVEKPGLLGEKGQAIRGHEFHYWDCTKNGDGFTANKPLGGKQYPCMVHTNSMAAGFPHFYYYSNPEMIFHFLEKCESFRAGRLAKAHWDSIAKPIDSLGLLEDHVVKLCCIAKSPTPYDLQKKALVVFCGDHGVVSEGVTQTGKEVTRIVSENFAKGCSTVNIMARTAGADVYPVDIGMDTPRYPEKKLVQGAVIDRKVARGTKNIAKEAAMTVEQCKKALAVGTEIVKELKEKGYSILATGEMGIGNTTPTSALAAIFLEQPAEKVTGKGAGLSDEGILKKRRAVQQAALRVKEKGLTDPVEILAEAGGYEIAGMAGLFLGGMKYRIPVVIDGAISAVAALVAYKMNPCTADFMLASHVSAESAGELALKELGLKAMVYGKLCLGEGTGAVTLFPLLDMAMEVYRRMGTFEAYQIDPYERFGQ